MSTQTYTERFNLDPNMLPLTDTARRFLKFHRENPHVWTAICRICRELLDDGFQECSMWAIFNKLRWERYIETKGEEKFKLSNDFIAYYTRLMIACWPGMKDFFTTCRMMREWEPTPIQTLKAKSLWNQSKLEA